MQAFDPDLPSEDEEDEDYNPLKDKDSEDDDKKPSAGKGGRKRARQRTLPLADRDDELTEPLSADLCGLPKVKPDQPPTPRSSAKKAKVDALWAQLNGKQQFTAVPSDAPPPAQPDAREPTTAKPKPLNLAQLCRPVQAKQQPFADTVWCPCQTVCL